MENYKLLMAKIDHEDSGLWLPLWMHLKDTAGVMKKLVHRWLPESAVNASGLEFDDFEKAAVFAAAVHDIGKATSYFQSIISVKNHEKRDELLDAGFAVRQNYASAGKTPHSYAGQWILQSDAAGFQINRSIADIIGAHHGRPLNSPLDDLLKIYEVNFYGAENDKNTRMVWKSAWKYFVDEALTVSGVQSADRLPGLSSKAQVILSGLLITADWIASNTNCFPLISVYDYGEPDIYPERVNKGFDKINFPEGWHPEVIRIDERLFAERFGFFPNNIQRTVTETVQQCRNPGIFILEAPMGSGKTEAALAASELLASEKGSGGLFFGLPTQATGNGIFGRLYDWAVSVSEDTANSIRLAHGAAQLNEEYSALFDSEAANVDDIETENGGLSVHPWFQGNKKALLADFVIGTVDQFLMASLKRKHFMLRHLGLVGKIVVIDECHAYDAYMNRYLDRTLEWMAAYGVPVILLSATLPAKRREDLIRSYVKSYLKYGLGRKQPVPDERDKNWNISQDYPLLTWTDGGTICQKKIKTEDKKHNVKISRIKSVQEALKQVDMLLKDGGCACIILNTVKKAQEVYETARTLICDAQILLYHAQFTMPDRAQKENLLAEHMGKNSTQSGRYRFILIGTQVLEQSLDYDADIMVTQLCPMDLLLQRTGRLHRHQRSRPGKLQNPECLILTDGEEIFDKGTEAVYGRYLLLKTWELLSEKLIFPDDIPRLVQETYSTDKDTFSAEISEAGAEFDNMIRAKEQRAKRYMLERPPENIEKILENSDETVESAAQCGVRDCASSLDVLLMKEEENGYITGAGHDKEQLYLDPFAVPTNPEGRYAARQRLRLPYIFSQPWLIGKTVSELEDMNRRKLAMWQKSHWIKGELVLLLDRNGFAQLCGYSLSYSKEMGLKYIKKEEPDAG